MGKWIINAAIIAAILLFLWYLGKPLGAWLAYRFSNHVPKPELERARFAKRLLDPEQSTDAHEFIAAERGRNRWFDKAMRVNEEK